MILIMNMAPALVIFALFFLEFACDHIGAVLGGEFVVLNRNAFKERVDVLLGVAFAKTHQWSFDALFV